MDNSSDNNDNQINDSDINRNNKNTYNQIDDNNNNQINDSDTNNNNKNTYNNNNQINDENINNINNTNPQINNRNFGSSHVLNSLEPLTSAPQAIIDPKDVTNTPPTWMSNILGENITFENQTNLDLDLHIFGSTEKFDIPEGEIRPPLYRMFEFIGANQKKEIAPLSDKIDVIVSYVNESKQIVKLIKREAKSSSKFAVLERHTHQSRNQELITFTLTEFNQFLSDNKFINYTLNNNNINYQ